MSQLNQDLKDLIEIKIKGITLHSSQKIMKDIGI